MDLAGRSTSSPASTTASSLDAPFALAGIPDRSWYRALELGLLEPVALQAWRRMIGSEPTVAQRICAAVLSRRPGRDGVAPVGGVPLGHSAAGDDPIDVLLPRRVREASVAGAELHRPRDLKDLTPVLRTGIRTTNILRTLCDLGALDAPAVQACVGHVVTHRTGVTGAALRKAGRPPRAGEAGPASRRCEDALDEWVLDGKPVDSILERRRCDRCSARTGYRRPSSMPVIAGYEVDFWIVDSPIVLECDGWTSHGLDRVQFEKDRARDAELTALGDTWSSGSRTGC